MKRSNFGTIGKIEGSRRVWPRSLKVAITLILMFHAVAIWVGVWAAPPSSELQRDAASAFRPYYGLIDQGYSYRFYAPDPPPTPVLIAEIRFDDGRIESIRIPDRSTRPRLLYQRQLALANHLRDDVEQALRATGHRNDSVWAQSFARHIGKTHPGAKTVSLAIEMHAVPDPNLVREAIDQGRSFDLDDPSASASAPERIGDFPCDAS